MFWEIKSYWNIVMLVHSQIIHYELKYAPPPPNAYVEALTPNVNDLETGILGKRSRLDEVLRVGP